MWNILYDDKIGSEGGQVIVDEEYKNRCRITLEKCEKWYAITCGVYGGMVHTAFFGESEARSKYVDMKKELQEFIDRNLDEEERRDFYDKFTSKY